MLKLNIESPYSTMKASFSTSSVFFNCPAVPNGFFDVICVIFTPIFFPFLKYSLISFEYLIKSGGIFRDMTIHDFDLSRYIISKDRITEIYAKSSNLIDQNAKKAKDQDTAMIIMKTNSGVLIHINNSRRAVYGYDQRIELFGSRGMIISDNQTARMHYVDENPETAGKFQIRGIPTMLLFNNGELIDTKVGMSSKADLTAGYSCRSPATTRLIYQFRGGATRSGALSGLRQTGTCRCS